MPVFPGEQYVVIDDMLKQHEFRSFLDAISFALSHASTNLMSTIMLPNGKCYTILEKPKSQAVR